ncbi:MAG: amylo-alpha-1,6-glucosidase [Clostridia bacterium]
MKIEKEKLEMTEGIQREWLITNGIGGYAASTVLGINTRKYHGLLVAPLTPPARRHLILSKVDESIEIEGNKYDIYSNMCHNYISKGYKYEQEFEKEYIPIFTYKVNNVTIKKLICMEHGKNTVCILYKIYNNGTKAKFTITPVVNFRDFHVMNTNHEYDIRQTENSNKVKLIIDNNSNTPVYMYVSEGKYIKHENDTFRNMFYIEEEKRGFFPEENLAVPGRFEMEIPENTEKEIRFICSLEENIEEINIKKVINKEIIRINELMQKTEILDSKIDIEKETKEQKKQREMLKYFMIAIDNFIVYRPSFGYHTIIAGYPWFLDWGRDSLISFEGLLLCTKQYGVAKEVLLTMTRDIKFGLVPNGYSGYDNRPLYNSVDSSLLLFEQIYKYLTYTKDYKFIKENFYNKLKSIIENYKKGIDLDNNNIFLDKDFLISSGTPETQNTWMDAKYGNHAFTPRNGKAVEINALWYNALMIMAELSIKFGDKKEEKEYLKLAEECKKSFEEKFYNNKRNCLYDVLGDSKIRPNQLFALSLSYPVINPESDKAKNIISVVEKKLLNKYGLKTLAKGEKGYIDIYEGDGFKRDSSYHQGITWPWLLRIIL